MINSMSSFGEKKINKKHKSQNNFTSFIHKKKGRKKEKKTNYKIKK